MRPPAARDSPAGLAANAPQVRALNDTYQGRYLLDWDQDAFLGIRYVQRPLGPLRYRRPQSINTSFDGVRNDGLFFHGAIMESGGPAGGTQVQTLPYSRGTCGEPHRAAVGCSTAKDELACLRSPSPDEPYAAPPTLAQVWNPLIDGDFLTRLSGEAG